MKKTLFFASLSLLFSACAFFATDTYAQSDDTIRVWREVKTLDGYNFIGQILTESDGNIVLETPSLIRITLPAQVIKRQKEIDPLRIRNGKYWFDNPNATRLFFAPTAIPMGKGEGYYQNFDIVYNGVNYGLTKNFSIGAAAIPFAWFMDEGLNIAVTPKLAVSATPSFHVGGGMLFAFIPGGYTKYLGIAYGLATVGNRDNNFTFGAGYGFLDRNKEGLAIVEFGGMVRLGRRFGLVSENWLALPAEGSNLFVFSYGARYIGERVSVDIGFINQREIAQEILIGIPLAGVVIYFGD